MNSKTLLLVALMATYGLGFANAAGAADAQSASNGETVQQGFSVQTNPARGSGHMALSEDRTAAEQAADRIQSVPGNQYSSAQAPVRALNQEIFYPPYTY